MVICSILHLQWLPSQLSQPVKKAAAKRKAVGEVPVAPVAPVVSSKKATVVDVPVESDGLEDRRFTRSAAKR